MFVNPWISKPCLIFLQLQILKSVHSQLRSSWVKMPQRYLVFEAGARTNTRGKIKIIPIHRFTKTFPKQQLSDHTVTRHDRPVRIWILPHAEEHYSAFKKSGVCFSRYTNPKTQEPKCMKCIKQYVCLFQREL